MNENIPINCMAAAVLQYSIGNLFGRCGN